MSYTPSPPSRSAFEAKEVVGFEAWFYLIVYCVVNRVNRDEIVIYSQNMYSKNCVFGDLTCVIRIRYIVIDWQPENRVILNFNFLPNGGCASLLVFRLACHPAWLSSGTTCKLGRLSEGGSWGKSASPAHGTPSKPSSPTCVQTKIVIDCTTTSYVVRHCDKCSGQTCRCSLCCEVSMLRSKTKRMSEKYLLLDHQSLHRG